MEHHFSSLLGKLTVFHVLPKIRVCCVAETFLLEDAKVLIGI